jgi:hypothetical protein
MAELDHLLGADVGSVASRAATVPDFDELAARGRRRRARRRTAVASALAVVAIAGTAAFPGIGQGRSTVPQPAVPSPLPSPSRTTSEGASPKPDPRPSPVEIVDDPNAFVRQVVVQPENPDARAVVWGLCSDARCRKLYSAIAVTGDGFTTRAVVGVPGPQSTALSPAGTGGFLLSGDGPPRLLRLDGAIDEVELTGETAPQRSGETVTRWSMQRGLVAVDPASADAHPIPVPAGTLWGFVAGSSELEVLARERDGAFRLAWSDDGGATWQEHTLAETFPSPVPSAVPGLHAVLGGADGATLFPFITATRGLSEDSSWATFAQPDEPRAYLGLSAVLADGRLMVDVVDWSDARTGEPGSKPRGLYVSVGDDWSRIEPLAPGPDSGLSADERHQLESSELEMRGVSVGAGHVTLYVGPVGKSDVIYSVSDGGTTWTRESVR